MTTGTDAARDRVAAAAVALVEDGMVVGLGTGDTARRFVEALGRRVRDERLQLRCVVTSNATAALARARRSRRARAARAWAWSTSRSTAPTRWTRAST